MERKANNTTVKCWCKHCKTELKPSHTGPCPKCGKTGKNCTVAMHAVVGIRASIRARQKRAGFKKFLLEVISRWRPSINPRLKDGVHEDRVIDKGRRKYHHTVKDAKTGEVIHEEHEQLENHRGKPKN